MTDILRDPLIIRLIATVLLVLAVLGTRFLIGHWIKRGAHILQEQQRRQLFYLRSLLSGVFLLALVIIWAGQLQNLVLSLTAVMVALVIATKELLMCLSGFLLRSTGRLFSVGDWIECNGLRGEVTDHTLLSTTLLEIDVPEHGYGYTGRSLMLPNSMFLSHPVHTSAFARQYVQHWFTITIEEPLDPVAATERLQHQTEQACTPFLDEARRINEAMNRRLGVEVTGPEPFVNVGTSDIGKTRFTVVLFCPTGRAAALEREIAGTFLRAVKNGEFAPVPAGDAVGAPVHE